MDWSRFNELVEAIRSGHIHDSLNQLKRMAESETVPEDKVAIYVAMSTGYSRQKRFHEARSMLHEASAILGAKSEFYPRIRLALAVVGIDEENWKDALKILDGIIEHHGALLQRDDNKDLLDEVKRNRGFALFELNRAREALPLLQSVRSDDYHRERTLYYIAACNVELANFDAAILDFDELLSLDLNSVYRTHAHYNLGRIFYTRLQLARAKNEFEKCLACPDKGNLSDEQILQALVYSCEGLNLREDAARYKEMLRSIR